MISLALGLILFTGIYEAFNSLQQSQRYVQGLALIQENGQLASYILYRELSQVGFSGCRKIDGQYPVAMHISDQNAAPFDQALLIHGYTTQNLPDSAKFLVKKMLVNSSAIALQFMQTQTASLLQPISTPGTWLSLNNVSAFKVGDKLMVADCMHADIVKVLQTTKDNRLQSNALLQNYPAGTQIGHWQEEWFYVGNTGRLNEIGQPITALYIHQPDGRDEELIDNVSNMHVQYGFIVAGNLQFVTASKVANWSLIKAVRVILLLNSGEPILANKQPVVFDGVDWLPQDHNLYRQWEIVVALPNR